MLSGSFDETAATFLDDGMASEAALKSEIALRSAIVGVPPGEVPSADKVFDYSLVRQAAQRLRADRWQPAE